MRCVFWNGATRRGDENIFLLVVSSFNHVNYGEEVPFVGNLELPCGKLLVE